MRRRVWLLALGLLQGSACTIDNPRNCVSNVDACSPSERCNPDTQRCETLDCTANLSLCAANEYCEAMSKRCTAKDCVLDATLCDSSELCDVPTRQCVTRSFVLGQPDAKSNLNAAYGMNSPYSVLLVPNPAVPGTTRLIVGELNNQRVLIWNDLPQSNRPADAVLGAPDVSTLNSGAPYGGVSERSFNQPGSLASDGKRLVVGDLVLQRLLSWSTIPTQPSGLDAIPANQLWGQSDFESSSVNGGANMVNAGGVNAPLVFLDTVSAINSFYVADRLNNRVLVFGSGFPVAPSVQATYVLGQTVMNTNAAGTSDTTLRDPRGMASDGTKLYVVDVGNHRVLSYALPIAANGVAATAVIGQATLIAGSPNAGLGAPTATSLNSPTALSFATSGGQNLLFVADQANNRVLRFPLPLAAVPTASLVLGQANAASNAPNRGGTASTSTLFQPAAVSSDGTHLAVTDTNNNRVLLWNSMPTANGQAADVVLGQPDAQSTSANNPPSITGLQFRNPIGVVSDGVHLAIADSMNNRVLLWNSMPQSGDKQPDVVIGQADFTSTLPNRGGAISAISLSNPQAVSFDEGHLLIADADNRRVLIWNQIPTDSTTPADYVVGQANFTTVAGGPLASVLGVVTGVAMSQGSLYVGDQSNHRVLIYRNPLMMNPTPNLVLGQPALTTNAPNQGGLSASSLNSPRTVLIADGKLLVADRDNQRVLIWKVLPTTNKQPASTVVGQLDFVSAYTHADRSRLAQPRGILVKNGRLYVASASQHRILYWNQIPTTNGQRADGVLGQTDFVSTLPNNPDLQPLEKLTAPATISAFGKQLFIADAQNHRIVVRPEP